MTTMYNNILIVLPTHVPMDLPLSVQRRKGFVAHTADLQNRKAVDVYFRPENPSNQNPDIFDERNNQELEQRLRESDNRHIMLSLTSPHTASDFKEILRRDKRVSGYVQTNPSRFETLVCISPQKAIAVIKDIEGIEKYGKTIEDYARNLR